MLCSCIVDNKVRKLTMEMFRVQFILAFHLLMLTGYGTGVYHNSVQCNLSSINHTFLRADCSNRNLDTISVLSFNESVIDINLSDNNFQIIPFRNPFPNHLRKIDISSCELYSIQIGAFRKLQNLTHLDVSQNNLLSLKVLLNISNDLIGSNIKSLKLNAIECPVGEGNTLRYDHVCRLQNTSLTELEISQNRIDMVEQFTLQALPKSLNSISAGRNRLRFGWYFLEFGSLENLRFLNLSDMYATESPFRYSQCFRGGLDRKQYISNNLKTCPEIKKHIDKSILNRTIVKFNIPNVETIVINNCVIRETRISEGLNIVFHSLKRLHANNNFLPVYQYIDFSQKLEEAYLSRCFIEDIDESLFLTTNLSILDLSYNYLSRGFFLTTKKAVSLFKRQVNLKYLNLAHNRLRSIPINLFENLGKLNVLNLSNNGLTEINFKMNGLKQLTTLDLSFNRLQTLSASNIHDIDFLSRESSSNLTLNLSGNTFVCTCDTLDFLKWIESKQGCARGVILTSLKNDTCSFANLKTKKLSEISTIILALKKDCFSKSILIVFGVLVLMVFFCFVSFGIIYRYRWKLRYFYYLTRRSLRGYFLHEEDNDKRRKYFQFDAFISYAEKDSTFAYKELKFEVLKRNPSIQLCYHHEHFLPGSSIAENIVNAIHNSRKTICVLSEHFLASEWCLYEFNMANIEKIYNRGDESCLIFLLLGNVSTDSIPVTMMSYLQSTSYMEVPQDIDDQHVFWNNLCDIIYDD